MTENTLPIIDPDALESIKWQREWSSNTIAKISSTQFDYILFDDGSFAFSGKDSLNKLWLTLGVILKVVSPLMGQTYIFFQTNEFNSVVARDGMNILSRSGVDTNVECDLQSLRPLLPVDDVIHLDNIQQHARNIPFLRRHGVYIHTIDDWKNRRHNSHLIDRSRICVSITPNTYTVHLRASSDRMVIETSYAQYSLTIEEFVSNVIRYNLSDAHQDLYRIDNYLYATPREINDVLSSFGVSINFPTV